MVSALYGGDNGLKYLLFKRSLMESRIIGRKWRNYSRNLIIQGAKAGFYAWFGKDCRQGKFDVVG
jgi:hypothetical protein